MHKFCFVFLFICLAGRNYAQNTKTVVLFNGHNLRKWEGDKTLWRIDSLGSVTAGDINVWQKQNDFLYTKKNYENYILNLDFKLEGDTGFLNSGVQVHSQRNKVPPTNEMVGFQIDMGKGYWGCIYDETRRNIIIAKADQNLVKKVLHDGGWNHYEIQCIGRRMVVLLNGVQTVDYTEPQNQYPCHGKIGLQIHGGSKIKVSFKNIILQYH